MGGCTQSLRIRYEMGWNRLSYAKLPHAEARALCKFEEDKIFVILNQRNSLDVATRDSYHVFRSCMLSKGFSVTVTRVILTMPSGSVSDIDPAFFNRP